jgi:hypothetical protein
VPGVAYNPRMSLEVIVLGVVSGVRPGTSQAAVFALLRTPAAARSLVAFVVAGGLFSVGVGLIVAVVFDGAGALGGRSTFADVVNIVGGVAALGFAAGVQRGELARRRERSRPADERTRRRPGVALAKRLHDPSARTAATAGVATHVPGLIYLVALNSIAAAEPGFASTVLQVSVYNALWFMVPLAALVVAIRSPEAARAQLDRATAVARRHEEGLLVVIFGALGIYFTLKGLFGLL